VIFIREHEKGALITVHAQPRASRDSIVGIHGDALKIAVRSPPVDSAANEAIADLLASTFGLACSAVNLKSGSTSRRKVFQLGGMDAQRAKSILEGKIP
jgi:uncharacterized protein